MTLSRAFRMLFLAAFMSVPATVVCAADPPIDRSPAWVLTLTNGDRLTATPEAAVLGIRTSANELREVSVHAVRSGFFDSNLSPRMTLTLTNDESVNGSPNFTALKLRLQVGGNMELGVNNISSFTAGPRPSAASSAPGSKSPSEPGSANSQGPEGFVWIPPGEFLMGSSPEEVGRDLDEGPQTKVLIPTGFWMCRHEVTQGEYRRVVGSNPSINAGDPERPVEKVTWYEAVEYCSRLTKETEATGRLPKNCVFRLPTEAEWEYACRAGAVTRFSYGQDRDESQLPEYAWFVRNSESITHPVGQKKPNAYGLFDMHGNVWEWCLDRWEPSGNGNTVTNRPSIISGNLRCARGGSWLYEARACRCANRDDYSASNRCGDVGFRVILAPAY